METKQIATKFVTKLINALIDIAFHYTGLYFTITGYLHHDVFKLALGGILFIESTISGVGTGIQNKLEK